MPSSKTSTFDRILAVVRRIPRGRVMTYGQVARAAGFGRGARLVSYALRSAKRPVPWQRVVGQKRPGFAHVTIKDPAGADLQRQMLKKEGVKIQRDGTIALEKYGAE